MDYSELFVHSTSSRRAPERNAEDFVVSENEETKKHLDYLDGWRGFAIAIVIFGHFWGDRHLWSGMSTFGVQYFFALSGRLMAEILFVRKVPLALFFVRRGSRIYPALLAYVIVISIAAAGTAYAHGIVAALSALTFTINYGMIFGHQVALLDHIWSLCVEEHAYIVLAGVALLHRHGRVSAGPIIALLSCAAITSGAIGHYVFGQPILDTIWRSDVAAAGIFLAGWAWLHYRRRKVSSWFPIAALVLAVACRLTSEYIVMFGVSPFLLAVAVATVDQAPDFLKSKILSSTILRKLGALSYSLYLWQQPFYKLHHDGQSSLTILLPLAFLLALLSYNLIEQPARSMINRYYDRHARQAIA